VYPLVPTQGSLFYSGGVFNYYPGVLLDYHKQVVLQAFRTRAFSLADKGRYCYYGSWCQRIVI